MPQALIALAPATFGIGGSLALVTATGALTLAGVGVSLAGSLLLSAAAGALASTPKPENVQLTIRQAVGPRLRHYGLVRAGGTMVFFRTKAGFFYRLVVHGHGRIDGIESYILNKEVVTLDGDGYVTDPQYDVGGRKRVRVLTRPGAVPSSVYAALSAVWPAWDADHRLDGLWTSLTIAEQVNAKKFRAVYPNSEPPLEIVARTSRVRDPRSGVVAYSTNAAAIIGDLITHPDGFNRPGRLNAATFAQAADDSDDALPLAAGGTEPRYRLCGSYALNERPQDVAQKMLDACAGDLYLMPDGTIGLSVGKWREPTVTLTLRDVIGLSDLSSGPDAIDRYNDLPFVYTDPALQFTQTSGENWLEEDRAAEDGEVLTGPQLDLSWSPSHAQGRRVARIRTDRDNPAQELTLICHPRAVRGFYERVITLDVPELGLSGPYRIRRRRLDLDTGRVTYVLAAVQPAAFSWSIALEGEPQVMPEPDVSEGIPAPTGFAAAAAGIRVTQANFAAGIGAVWGAPPSDALVPDLSYRRAGASSWVPVALDADAVSARLGPLEDGEAYDLRLALRASDETLGPYVTLSGIVAAADAAAPAAPTALSVTDLGAGEARVRVTSSASASNWLTRIFRDGVLIAEIIGAPGVQSSFTDACGPGAFSWTARAVNISGVLSATAAGPVSKTIT